MKKLYFSALGLILSIEAFVTKIAWQSEISFLPQNFSINLISSIDDQLAFIRIFHQVMNHPGRDARGINGS